MNKQLKVSAIVMTYLVVIFIALEVALRTLGYRVYEEKDHTKDSVYHQVDDRLGWKLIPGSYDVGPLNDLNDTMTINIKAENGRITRAKNTQVGSDKVVFIGGSFIMGEGIDDNQTCVWKLQERFKNLDLRNLGVGAYGTYQSLMVLESEVEKANKPKCVIYGMINHHRFRDVAQSEWLEMHYYNSGNIHPKVPYIELKGEKEILRKQPIGMTELCFSDKSVAILMAQRAYNKLNATGRERDAKKLSRLVIKEMQRICKKNDIEFYVSVLAYWEDQMEDLKGFFDENNIKYIDCNVRLTAGNTIKNDGHPDESVNDIWANRIGEKLISIGLSD